MAKKEQSRTEIKDTRMRYEQSHPWSFTFEHSDREAYAKGFDAIDWSDRDRPNQARPRKNLPHVKAKGRF